MLCPFWASWHVLYIQCDNNCFLAQHFFFYIQNDKFKSNIFLYNIIHNYESTIIIKGEHINTTKNGPTRFNNHIYISRTQDLPVTRIVRMPTDYKVVGGSAPLLIEKTQYSMTEKNLVYIWSLKLSFMFFYFKKKYVITMKWIIKYIYNHHFSQMLSRVYLMCFKNFCNSINY